MGNEVSSEVISKDEKINFVMKRMVKGNFSSK